MFLLEADTFLSEYDLIDERYETLKIELLRGVVKKDPRKLIRQSKLIGV